MKSCPYCGGDVSDNAKVCGQPLGVPPAPPRTGGLPVWALAIGGVLVVLVVVLVAALIARTALPSRAEPTHPVEVVLPIPRTATATLLVPAQEIQNERISL